ncbi:Uncharacterized protein FWK35_00023426, partial [Aphis craccivora]
MGKYSKYEKKYNKDWELLPCFSGWLQIAPDDFAGKGEAYCKLCRTPLRAHKTDLIKHSSTNCHKQRANRIGIKSNNDKIRDLKLALFIATHSAIRNVDHLGELLKAMSGTNSRESRTLHDGKQPSCLIQLSTTRWLSWHNCVKAVLTQWLPLKTHFGIVSQSKEGCHSSRTLSDMFNDETHLLYLLFLIPVLHAVTQ